MPPVSFSCKLGWNSILCLARPGNLESTIWDHLSSESLAETPLFLKTSWSCYFSPPAKDWAPELSPMRTKIRPTIAHWTRWLGIFRGSEFVESSQLSVVTYLLICGRPHVFFELLQSWGLWLLPTRGERQIWCPEIRYPVIRQWKIQRTKDLLYKSINVYVHTCVLCPHQFSSQSWEKLMRRL